MQAETWAEEPGFTPRQVTGSGERVCFSPLAACLHDEVSSSPVLGIKMINGRIVNFPVGDFAWNGVLTE